MVLVQNWPFLRQLFLANIGQEKVFYDILERKTAFLDYKNNKFKKLKNWDFCEGGNPWFWCKIGHFSIFFFLGIIGQENVFYDILERKNAFHGYKNSKFKKWKNWDFCKRVNPWFWSKLAIFPSFIFLGVIGQENVFYDILERRNAFLGSKNSKLKKWKNWDFCKGLTHGFGPKLAIFPSFLFRQYRSGKSVLRYSRTKKCLSRLSKQ